MTETPESLKNLRKQIVKEFHLPIVDACEIVDLVAWGQMTREQVLRHLSDFQKDDKS